jgi:hypothetical protein
MIYLLPYLTISNFASIWSLPAESIGIDIFVDVGYPDSDGLFAEGNEKDRNDVYRCGNSITFAGQYQYSGYHIE